MGKIFTFFFILLGVGFKVNAQNLDEYVRIDSLETLVNKSNSLTYEYKIKESLEQAMKLANYAHELDNDHYRAEAYYLLGYNYHTLLDYKIAEKNFRKSLKYAEMSNDSLLILWNYNGLGNVFSDGYKNIEKSLVYYDKATKMGKRTNSAKEYMTPIINLAWTYIDINKPDKAYPYIEKADSLVTVTRDLIAYSEVNYLRGKYYLMKGDIDKSEEHYNNAIIVAEQHNMILELSYIYKGRSELYEQKGEIDKAYEDSKLYQETKDKLYDQEKLKQIEVARVSFEVEEYERQLEVARKEQDYQKGIARNNKIISLISIIGVALLLIVMFFFYLGYRSKKRLNDVLKLKNDQLYEAKSEAEKLAQVKSQFVSTVSHELRTPLYGVVGITSLLLEDDEVSEKHQKLLGSLKFSGDYLLNLINNVLQISKIESKKVELVRTPTNLVKLSQNLLNSFEYQAKSKNNELILEVPKELPKWLNVDSLRLSEILINLIGNSSKFTENGKVWLRIKIYSLEDKFVDLKFEIEDNGLGIPDDKRDFVFEKFSQVDRESNNLEGTGLGLTIVKNLLSIMDSEIHLESKEGKGTKFWFDLRLEILEDNDDNGIDLKEDEVVKTHGKILVAEDNKINQIVTKNLLNLIGYDCVIVENGFNAIQMVKKESFDLILMDLNMPYVDGNEATRRIRQFDTNTPIVALTAAELGEVKEECMAIGMNDIINKPLNKNDLKNIIEKNLQS